jgi:TRAP-type C4-dicarboxylate transport system permease small subunit
MMFLIMGDIVGRSVLKHSIIGTSMFSRNAIVGITFLALPLVTWQRKHLRSELVVNKATGVFRFILELATYVIGMAMFVLYFASLIKPTAQAIRIHETDFEGKVFIPMVPFYFTCLGGCLLSAIGCLKCLLETAFAGKISAPPAPEQPSGFEI